jgi:uncharacterized alkaline shock family protein YloU
MELGRLRGRVSITEQVIASIAGVAASGVEGVSGLRGNVAENLKAFLGEEHRRRGVIARVEEGSVQITLHVAIEYGHPIHEVAQSLQERVKEEVEAMTGLRVTAVDVYVNDLTLPEGAWETAQVSEPQSTEGETPSHRSRG